MCSTIRPMREEDLEAADHVVRLAFGTLFGLKDPLSFGGDSGFVRPRWRSDPEAAYVAEEAGRIVGSIIAMDWGSIGVLGPLTVHPEYWGRGIARLLIPPILALFERRRMALATLFTHPESPKHVRLYESFGFAMQFNTLVMEKPLDRRPMDQNVELYNTLPPNAQNEVLSGCRATTDSIFPGLDLAREIRAAAAQRLGDTLLLREASRVIGFAVCHVGAGTEAGSGTLYLKFAAVRPGAAEAFAALLDGCEALAAARGAARVVAGVNSARREAYHLMQARGYRSWLNGVTMNRPDQAGLSRRELFVIDDGR